MGGECTIPLHITCQKVTVGRDVELAQVCSAFVDALAGVAPFHAVGHHVEVWYSEFRVSSIAKCLVPLQPSVSRAIDNLNERLDRLEIRRHYFERPVPDHVPVTVLEGLANGTPVAEEHNRLVQRRIFTVADLVVSRLDENGEFDIIQRQRLGRQ
jgi:hypothetical protein